MWKISEKRPFFRADMAGLGKYCMGRYGRIGVYRVKKHIDKFDNVQKRALRIISYGRGANKTYEDTMREYDVQKLHNRRKEHLLMNMFAHQINPEYVDMNRPDMLLRNHDGTKFKIRVTRNQKVYKSPYYRGVKLWEQLPNATRTLHGKKEFKSSIKGILL